MSEIIEVNLKHAQEKQTWCVFFFGNTELKADGDDTSLTDLN